MGQIDKTPDEYQRLISKNRPADSKIKNFFTAYITGGTICLIGQLIIELLQGVGFSISDASALNAIILIFVGGLLTGLGVYDEIAQFAGAGTIVPITGFSNAIVAPAMEHKQEGYILGLGPNIYSVAGPVLTYGMLSAIIIGIIKILLSY
ncbi:stage V sporulation protein AC [Halobacteroides halobius DSM 5150]|uniref:Stage V sporulation protein AC n=1 Tax=Halobacteroides halobius (strain ATCC 35273 / DSM 5150 / MD-1) TaxID=748449 RepID=L0K6B2_HALHC|nr:stage V sporulation protein AC [Halobacteroides halobius]AGB40566.1 stage V sporulation protein AC [Halobacteroides halobius DSM 5150]